MSPTYNSAAERNKNAQLTSGYDEIARSLFSDGLSVVGNYELGEVIGKGSFGKVYLAYHTMTRTKVVIKAAEKFQTEGLAREIYHHRRLRHPHITKLYEVIHTEKHVWLVLEYCPGGELFDYLYKHKRLKEPVVQRMFAQLCGAVIYIHKAGCVHRDLKLENILLDKSENVKLGDFGFTREYEPKKLLETWCGTYSYAAPEMIQGEKYAGEAVDVWGMGVILYALLCGELPFDHEDESVTKEKIIKREYTLPDFLSSDAKLLISSMLAKPEDRPTLAKIITHPFLAHHAARQLHILAHNLVIPFAAPIEKRLLDRFEKANIDTRVLIQQMSEGGSGSMIGLWELSLDRARKLEEYKKRKKKRRKSHDLEVIPSLALMDGDADMVSTPQELTPMETRFAGREYTLPRPPELPNERPPSRGSRPQSRQSKSRSQSPSKQYTYRRPASPQKSKERASKGFFQALRNLMSDWTRQGNKLTHKKSKAALNGDANGLNGKDSKNPLELKKSKSGDSGSKDEAKRNRKAQLPVLSILPPTNRQEVRENTPYLEIDSPAPGNDDDESESTGGPRRSRRSRPSYRRRSTSSSINSLHSLHRYSHSKTSSTSSAGSGSVSTPRHNKSNLKIVPATPPPHMLTHEGAKGLGTVWGEGIVIARRRRSPFRGPPVGFMFGSGGKRKGQGKQNGKWPEGAIKEEDEEVMEDDIVDEGDTFEVEGDGDGEAPGRGSYDVGELDAERRGAVDTDADQRSLSASV